MPNSFRHLIPVNKLLRKQGKLKKVQNEIVKAKTAAIKY
jgi:hypothetical protein